MLPGTLINPTTIIFQIEFSHNRHAPSSVFSSHISQTSETPFLSVRPRETPKKSPQRELVSEAMVITDKRWFAKNGRSLNRSLLGCSIRFIL